MRWLAQTAFYVKSLFLKKKLEAQLSEEVRTHVEMATEANVAAGMSPEEARYAALREFGNVAGIKEQTRDERGWVWLENLVRDMRFSFRSLRRSPGFSLAVFLTLVLCLGPNTAVLSALYTLVLKPLPFRDPAQLAVVRNVGTKAGNLVYNTGLPQFQDFAAHADRFAGFALYEMSNTTIGEESMPVRASGFRVTANFFDLLGVTPLAGRFFITDEEVNGRDHILVLTQTFWITQYQANPAVIGQEVRMGGEAYTIVGIAPASLEAMFTRTDFFKPFQHEPADLNPERRFASRATLIGRLQPGMTPTAGQAQLTTIEERFRTQQASPAMRASLEKGGFKVTVERWRNEGLVVAKGPLWMLEAGAALVLLIGCVNVANLTLARASARRAELAIRLALGAGWRALFRQVFCEVLVLVGAAAVAGVALGWATLRFINHSVVFVERYAPPVTLDARISALVLLLGVGIALFVGLLPVLLLRRTGLRLGETRAASAGGGIRALSSALVVGQVALALMLLVGAGLMIRSFANVMAVDPGFDAAHVIQGRVALPHAYDAPTANVAIRQRLMDAVKEIPGIKSVAVSSYFGVGPASSYRALPYTVRRAPSATEETRPLALLDPVSPGFFSTMGTRILEGRDFVDDDDGRSGVFGMIVDRTFAERNFPGRSALGEEVAFGAGPYPADFHWPRIVGVVDRANVVGLEERDGLPFIYLSMGQQTSPGFNLLVRSSRPSADVLTAMRLKLHEIDPTLPLYNTGTLQETLDLMLLPRRALLLLLLIFASLALMLAAVGLYGVLAYDVSQRTREIGIRGAIGASREQIVGLIMRQGLTKAGLGLGAGLIGAFCLTRYLRSLLFDVHATDPLAFAAVSLLLLAVALLASWLPARRAAKVDPVIALRAE